MTGNNIAVGNNPIYLRQIYGLSKWPTWSTIPLCYNTFITVLYMFRTTSCSSSGGQILLIQYLVWSLSVIGRPLHRTPTYREWPYQMLY